MNVKKGSWLWLVTISVLLTAACGGGGSSFDTNFPLPDSVSNFSGEGGDSPINFQTDLSLDETVSFYRQALSQQGYTERTINTAITETTASLVFDGHDSGQALVVQVVDIGNGATNVNVRFEDI